jgi:uncharacterized phage infection (PIP) family protein YhgE
MTQEEQERGAAEQVSQDKEALIRKDGAERITMGLSDLVEEANRRKNDGMDPYVTPEAFKSLNGAYQIFSECVKDPSSMDEGKFVSAVEQLQQGVGNITDDTSRGSQIIESSQSLMRFGTALRNAVAEVRTMGKGFGTEQATTAAEGLIKVTEPKLRYFEEKMNAVRRYERG